MTLKCPVFPLRRLVVVALAVPLGACVIQNPGFIFETDGQETSAATAMTDAATITSSVDTASTDAVPTTDGTTTGVVTSTTMSTLPSDTTGGASTTDASTTDASNTDASNTDATSIGETSSDSSTGVQPDCEMKQVQDFVAVEDAFFIAGGSDGQTTCKYYDPITDSQSPCRQLNFGHTSALRVARMEGGIDAMFAARFPGNKLVEFVAQGNQIVNVQLIMTVYGEIAAPIEFRVGLITDQWVAGEGNGTFAMGGESNFEEYQLGFLAAPWTGGDGPRGASVEVATLSVPVGFGDHEQIASTPFDIAPWLADPFMAQGLVVSFFKDVAVQTFGPGLKAMEAGQFQPILRVTYCKP